MWRIWLSGKATLHEIEAHWSLVDLVEANEALDVEQEMEQHVAEQTKAEIDRSKATARH